MAPLRIFISSVQKEFAAERAALRDYLRGDALMRRFFEPFLFEDMPAADRRSDDVYLDEVARCDVYLGLFGDEGGHEDAGGASPTEDRPGRRLPPDLETSHEPAKPDTPPTRQKADKPAVDAQAGEEEDRRKKEPIMTPVGQSERATQNRVIALFRDEMIHLIERTHNARFVAMMDRAMPQWRLCREQLNRLPVRHEEWAY